MLLLLLLRLLLLLLHPAQASLQHQLAIAGAAASA
jgi:hypothetical protein